MANVTVRMGSFAMACVSGVVWCPVAREATVNPKSPLACETDICVVVPSSGAGRGGWTVIVVIELRERQDRRRSCVPARGGRWNESGYGTGSLVVVVPVSAPPPNRAME